MKSETCSFLSVLAHVRMHLHHPPCIILLPPSLQEHDFQYSCSRKTLNHICPRSPSFFTPAQHAGCRVAEMPPALPQRKGLHRTRVGGDPESILGPEHQRLRRDESPAGETALRSPARWGDVGLKTFPSPPCTQLQYPSPARPGLETNRADFSQ